MLTVEDHEPKLQQCDCRTKYEVITNYKNANIPKIYKNLKVDSFDTEMYESQSDKDKAKQAKRIAIKFVQNIEQHFQKNMGLFFYSKTKGSGKTRLAISILTALIKFKKIKGVYCSEYEIIEKIKGTFKSNESTHRIIEFYSNVELLIIDDFGLEQQTPWVQQTFTKIIDKRLSNTRLTIFTSNLTYKEIRAIYEEERLPSRLEAMTLFVPMPEEDIRVRMANEMKKEMIKDMFE